MQAAHAARLSLILLVAFGAVGSVAADQPAAVVPGKRIDLLPAKDFTGWTYFTRENAALTNTWSIEDGVVRCTGKPTGYLRTEKSYRDYRLVLEWRFVNITPKTDNTGILVHMQLPDALWPACVQCQGRHDKQGDLFLMGGAESKEHLGKDANTALPKQGDSTEKPVGEWNTCEMLCRGNSVKTSINGKLMNETTECTVASGFIGIQCEGAKLEIRALYLEPLP